MATSAATKKDSHLNVSPEERAKRKRRSERRRGNERNMRLLKKGQGARRRVRRKLELLWILLRR
jgi:hypothetical protein